MRLRIVFAPMSYETVEWEQDGGIGRITLNRPETLNAWNEQFGDDMKALLALAADDSVRAVLITRRGQAASRPAPTSRPARPHARRRRQAEHPPRARTRTTTRSSRRARAAEAGRRRRQRPRGRHRLSLALACDLVLAAESSFFEPRVREHRPDARRRLDAVRARRDRQGARVRDGAARRAGPARPRRSTGASSTPSTPTTSCSPRPDELVERLAAGPTLSYAGSKQALNASIYAAPGEPARPRGRPPARARPHERLRGGRDRLRPEARARVQGSVTAATKWLRAAVGGYDAARLALVAVPTSG